MAKGKGKRQKERQWQCFSIEEEEGTPFESQLMQSCHRL